MDSNPGKHSMEKEKRYEVFISLLTRFKGKDFYTKS